MNNPSKSEDDLYRAGGHKRLFLTSLVPLMIVMSTWVSEQADAGNSVISELDCLVEPSLTADIGSAVPGLIEFVHYERSDFVSAGVVLAELESGVEKAELAIAKRVANSETALKLRKLNAAYGNRTQNRNRALFQKASISSQTMDQVGTESALAQLQVKQEEENLELAALEAIRSRAALERRVITSPFEGSITKRYKDIGEDVEGEPIFQIAQLDPLHVEVIVPLTHLGKIEVDMLGKITLVAPGFEDQVLDARVRRIDSVADAASASYGVRLELANPDLMIPAGVRCQIDFHAQ